MYFGKRERMTHLRLSARVCLLVLVATAVTASSLRTSYLPRGKAKSIPAFPFDPNTAKYCVWWFDNEETVPAWSCEEIETLHGVSLQDFVYWNPSLNAESCEMHANQSYCIAALDEQHLGPGSGNGNAGTPEPTTVTVISTRFIEIPPPLPVTTTVVSTEIHTAAPPEPVIVTVTSTETAPVPTPLTVTVVSTAEEPPSLNPVTVTSVSLSIRTVLETVTLPPSTLPPVTITAVSTRVITQPAQVTSVSVTVPRTVTQTRVVSTTRTSTLQVVSVSVSVSVSASTTTAVRTTTATTTRTAVRTISVTATATITQRVTVQIAPPATCIQSQTPSKPTGGNGITTPSPIQDGITPNCKTFYFVQKGDDCQKIADRFGIPVDKFIAWNQGAKRDCSTLWAGTWACVAVL